MFRGIFLFFDFAMKESEKFLSVNDEKTYVPERFEGLEHKWKIWLFRV